MDEIKEIEESANSFLKNFFDTTYNDNKVLFNNMQSIYLLIIFLYNPTLAKKCTDITEKTAMHFIRSIFIFLFFISYLYPNLIILYFYRVCKVIEKNITFYYNILFYTS